MTQDPVEQHLAEGSLTLLGAVPDSSNATLLCAVESELGSTQAVFKPVAGERPLADFPTGTLARREIAAYRLSRDAGFDCVPPTVEREVPDLGTGSLQAWVEQPDPGELLVDLLPVEQVPGDWHPILRAEDEDGEEIILAHAEDPGLRIIGIFDLVVGNADRKGGHVLRGHWRPGTGEPARVLGIDHGLCFHAEDKLRTVLWGWAGGELTAGERARLEAVLRPQAVLGLGDLLADDEIETVRSRAAALLAAGRWSTPPRDRMPLPWPPL